MISQKVFERLIPYTGRTNLISFYKPNFQNDLYIVSEQDNFFQIFDQENFDLTTVQDYIINQYINLKLPMGNTLKLINPFYTKAQEIIKEHYGFLPTRVKRNKHNSIIDLTPFTTELYNRFPGRISRFDRFEELMKKIFEENKASNKFLLFMISPNINFLDSYFNKFLLMLENNKDFSDKFNGSIYIGCKDIDNELTIACITNKELKKDVVNSVRARALYLRFKEMATLYNDRVNLENEVEDQKSTLKKLAKENHKDISKEEKEIIDKAIETGLVNADEIISDSKKKLVAKALFKALASKDTFEEIKNYDPVQYEKKLKEFTSKKPKDIIKENEIDSLLIDEEILVADEKDPLKVQTMRSIAIREQYNKKLLEKDIIRVLESFNNPNADMPVLFNITGKEEFNDGLNAYTEYTIEYSAPKANAKNKAIKIQIPKLIDGKYYLIEGVRYVMYNQIVAKPIVKVKSDTVALTSLYNKLFVYRTGDNTSTARMSKLLYVLNKYNRNDILTKLNYNTAVEFPSKSYELDILKKFGHFHSYNNSYYKIFYFNLKEATKVTVDKEYYKIGEYNNSEILLDENELVYLLNRNNNKPEIKPQNMIFVDFLYKVFKKDIGKISRAGYTRINIVGKKIPLLFVLMAKHSLIEILQRAGIKYAVFSPEERVPEEPNAIVLNTVDGKIIFYATGIEHHLLLNPLLKNRDFIRDNVTIKDLFNKNKNIVVLNNMEMGTYIGIRNTFDKFIDPITLDLLKKYQLPTDMLGIFIYANNLLKDNKYKKPSDFSGYRIRNEETFPAMLYREISKQIAASFSTKDVTINLPPNYIQRTMITELSNVAPLSSSNPFYELDELNKATFSGFLGLNSSRSAVMELRNPDVSQKGIIDANAVTDNAKVGLIKYLSLNANLTDLRGSIEPITDEEFYENPSRGLSLHNSLEVAIASHADSSRVAMGSIQARHLLPLDGSYDKPLIRTGAEDVVTKKLSSDWVIKSPVDGKITAINEKEKLITILDDSTKKPVYVSYKDKILRNSGAGFYHKHSFHLDKKVKVGAKVEIDQILAYNDGVFKDGTLAVIGKYLWVCLNPTAELIEDAGLVSSRVTEQLVMKFIEDKEIIINPSQKVVEYAKIGAELNVNKPFLRFDVRNITKDEESSINALLKDIGDDTINEMNVVKSKVKGTISNIKVYYNRKDEDLSEVERDLINYLKDIDKKEKITNPEEKRVFFIESDRILGRKMRDSILIQYFIEVKKKEKSGSKMTMSSTKSVFVVKDDDLMPYSIEPNSLLKNKRVDAFISSLSLITRMTPNNIINGYSNKIVYYVLQKLKKFVKDKDIRLIRNTIKQLINSFYSNSNKKHIRDLAKKEISRFDSLSDKELIDMIINDDFYINMPPFHEPSIEDIISTAELFNIPLEEYVVMPELDNAKTERPVPILYVPIKFLNQIASKGLTQSHKVDEVNSETGQLTANAKTRQFSVDESLNLFSYNLEKSVLKEITLFRSDDREAFNSMERAILEKGSVSIDEISSSGFAQTANAISAYLVGAGYDNDMVSHVKVKVDNKTVDAR
jgi:hypothetical protein